MYKTLFLSLLVFDIVFFGGIYAKYKQPIGNYIDTKVKTYEKSSNGKIFFRIASKGQSKKPAEGEYVKFDVEKKSALGVKISGHKGTTPTALADLEKQLPGVFSKLGVNGRFVIREDSSMYAPYGMASGGDPSYSCFEVTAIMSKEEYDEWKKDKEEKERKAREEKQKKYDDQLKKDTTQIDEYLEGKKLTSRVKKAESGLRYIIHGPKKEHKNHKNINEGDRVKMHYTGRTLTGKVFDTTREEDAKALDPKSKKKKFSPVVLEASRYAVVPGFAEGLQLLKKGEKATLYLPSGLAYREKGKGENIGPNESLIFEVEIIDVIKADH